MICDIAEVTVIIGACADFPTNDCDADGVINSADICEGFDDAITHVRVAPSGSFAGNNASFEITLIIRVE